MCNPASLNEAAWRFLCQAELLLLAARHQDLPVNKRGQLASRAWRTLRGQATVDTVPSSCAEAELGLDLLQELGIVAYYGSALRASPNARAWLGGRPGRRLLDLFSAWERGAGPNGNDNTQVRCEVLAVLGRWPAGCPVSSSALGQALGRAGAMAVPVLPAIFAALLAMGVLGLPAEGTDGYVLTDIGRCLLAGRLPQDDAKAAARWTLDLAMTISVPVPYDSRLLFALESFADCLARPERYRLGARSIARGLGAGLTATAIVATMTEAWGSRCLRTARAQSMTGSALPIACDLCQALSCRPRRPATCGACAVRGASAFTWRRYFRRGRHRSAPATSWLWRACWPSAACTAPWLNSMAMPNGIRWQHGSGLPPLPFISDWHGSTICPNCSPMKA
jgi:hypothetical protein